MNLALAGAADTSIGACAWLLPGDVAPVTSLLNLQTQANSLSKLYTWVTRNVSAKLHNRSRQTVKKPDGWLKARIRWLAESDQFSQFFMVLILINSIAMAVEFDGMSDTMQSNLQVLNLILTGAFVVEVAVKVFFPLLPSCSC